MPSPGELRKLAVKQAEDRAARRSPAGRLYGKEGPKGGKPPATTKPSDHDVFTDADKQAVTRAIGAEKTMRLFAAAQKGGLRVGGPKVAPAEDRGAASPLGGLANA